MGLGSCVIKMLFVGAFLTDFYRSVEWFGNFLAGFWLKFANFMTNLKTNLAIDGF